MASKIRFKSLPKSSKPLASHVNSVKNGHRTITQTYKFHAFAANSVEITPLEKPKAPSAHPWRQSDAKRDENRALRNLHFYEPKNDQAPAAAAKRLFLTFPASSKHPKTTKTRDKWPRKKNTETLKYDKYASKRLWAKTR